MNDKNQPEPILHSIRDAARIIGVEPRQLRQAVNDRLVPSYKLRNSILMVCVQEVLSIMKSNLMEKDNVN